MRVFCLSFIAECSIACPHNTSHNIFSHYSQILPPTQVIKSQIALQNKVACGVSSDGSVNWLGSVGVTTHKRQKWALMKNGVITGCVVFVIRSSIREAVANSCKTKLRCRQNMLKSSLRAFTSHAFETCVKSVVNKCHRLRCF